MKFQATTLLAISAMATLIGCSHAKDAMHGAKNVVHGGAEKTAMDISIPQSVQTNCLSCHSIGAKNEPTNAIAPPLFAVKSHLSEFSDRDAFVAHVSSWVKAPSADSAKMPGAVKKFGLMPALPLADEDLEEIAGWIFDTPMDKPNWYAEHYRKEHGKNPTN